MAEPGNYDAIIVGAGIAGLYQLYRLREAGLAAREIEAADGVGGTWFWNRYPGARCDVQSLSYSYSFSPELEQEWEWTEKYPTQPEILRYVNHVADRFDLRRDIDFSTRVTRAQWDDAAARWTVHTDPGDGEPARAQFLIMATGCLSASKLPEIPGLERYRGRTHHTARWGKDEVRFDGMAVGVIGTGSSGIQSIPVIASQAADLTVFQRTPNFSMPAGNRLLAEFEGQDTSYAVTVNPKTGAQRALDKRNQGETGFVGTAISRDGTTVLGYTGGFDPGSAHNVASFPYGGGKAKVLVRNAFSPDWSR